MTERLIKDSDIAIQISDLNLWYGTSHALKDISIDIPRNKVTSLIGPSGCGKSTFIRCLNRMNDLIRSCRIEGEVLVDGENIYDDNVDVVELRKRVGMVFQKPNPFPMSIGDNISYGPRIHGEKIKRDWNLLLKKRSNRQLCGMRYLIA